MLLKTRRNAALGVALISVLVPGAAHAAGSAHVPVPGGQIQHTVTELS
jgi:hypothetical protein